jgi:hypothetical protein
MNRTTEHNATQRESGFVLVAMFALILALLGTGAAFMQWATDETYQGERAFAGMQAYYCAQTGLIERGLTWFSQQQEGLLPSAGVTLSGGTVPDVGTYGSVTVAPVFGATGEGDNFSFSNIFSITSVGKVKIPWEGNEYIEVERKAVMYVQVRSYVDYMYLTDKETSLTFPGDIIRFFGRDTLWGRTHSNDWIATQNVGGLPVAYDIVSTAKPGFRSGSPNPAFRFLGGDPIFNHPIVLLPELANPLRECSMTQHFEQFGEEWRLSLRGRTGYLYHWPEGTEFDSVAATRLTINLSPAASVFVHGRLEIEGAVEPDGCRLTVGCSEDIWLIDNVMIIGTNPANGTLPAGATSIIGIVGEQWIYIDNTTANGRENCTNGDHTNTNHARCHIILTCALVALGESFQFHQMNDVFDPYIGPNPDERGNIVMTGSITQRWRGYVHRSNNGGTGYNKIYHLSLTAARVYQLALVTPGIKPFKAPSRNVIREHPNLRM